MQGKMAPGANSERWGLPWQTDSEISARILSPNGGVQMENGTLKFNWTSDSFSKDDTAGNFYNLKLVDMWEVISAEQAVLPRFLYLTDACDEDILDFAGKWGPLWWSGKPAVPFFRPGVLADEEDMFLGCDRGARDLWKWKGEESCSLYRSAAWTVAFLTKCALGHAEGNIMKELQDPPLWKKRLGEFFVEGIFGVRAKHLGALKPSLAMKVLNRLLPIHSATGERFGTGKVLLCIKDGFLPVVAAETLKNIVETPERYFSCDECGRLYFRDGKMPKPSELNYCERCSIGGRGYKRAYARRKRQERSTG